MGWDVSKGLEGLDHNFLTGKLEDLVKWARRMSVMPATFGLACCAIEMMGAGGPHYDLARFGMETFRASPRQADLMIVAGRVSQKMAPVLRQIYDQMMEPKWVISMGVCASTGGMFNNYALVQGVDQIVPVDVYAPGCPPGPETLLHAINTLHEKIRDGELTRRQPGTGLGSARRAARRAAQQPAGRPVHPRVALMADEVAVDEADAPPAEAPELVHGAPVTWSHGQKVVHPDRADLSTLVRTLRDDDGYLMCLDVCGVDYLTYEADRGLPEGRASPSASRSSSP